MPVQPQFTPEQLATLRAFADHISSGRHFMSFMFKVIACIGAIGTAILAYTTFYQHSGG